MDAKDLTELVSSVRPPLAMAGIAGRGPGTLESEVEDVTASEVAASEEPGGVNPVIWSVICSCGSRLAGRPLCAWNHENKLYRRDYSIQQGLMEGTKNITA